MDIRDPNLRLPAATNPRAHREIRDLSGMAPDDERASYARRRGALRAGILPGGEQSVAVGFIGGR